MKKKFEEGDRVCLRELGYYMTGPGIVRRVHEWGTYDVEFPNGSELLEGWEWWHNELIELPE